MEQTRKAAAIAPLTFQWLTVCDQFAASMKRSLEQLLNQSMKLVYASVAARP
jgi:hypothetical protein